MFDTKGTHAKQLIHEHLSAVDQSLSSLGKMITAYLEGRDEFKEFSEHIADQEAKADDVMRRVKTKIYEGAFMAVFREDYITLVHLIDGIANRAETISEVLVQQSPQVPEGHHQDIKELIEKVQDCFEPLSDIVSVMDQSWEETHQLALQVEELEQESDRIEWDLIKEIFDRDDISLARKIQLRDMVQFIASLADRMEDASDRIDIMLVKRQV